MRLGNGLVPCGILAFLLVWYAVLRCSQGVEAEEYNTM
jgi:hypothetical protein